MPRPAPRRPPKPPPTRPTPQARCPPRPTPPPMSDSPAARPGHCSASSSSLWWASRRSSWCSSPSRPVRSSAACSRTAWRRTWSRRPHARRTWFAAPSLPASQRNRSSPSSRMPPGSLLVVETPPAAPTAAYTTEDGSAEALTDDQIAQLIERIPDEGPFVVKIDDVRDVPRAGRARRAIHRRPGAVPRRRRGDDRPDAHDDRPSHGRRPPHSRGRHGLDHPPGPRAAACRRRHRGQGLDAAPRPGRGHHRRAGAGTSRPTPAPRSAGSARR